MVGPSPYVRQIKFRKNSTQMPGKFPKGGATKTPGQLKKFAVQTRPSPRRLANNIKAVSKHQVKFKKGGHKAAAKFRKVKIQIPKRGEYPSQPDRDKVHKGRHPRRQVKFKKSCHMAAIKFKKADTRVKTVQTTPPTCECDQVAEERGGPRGTTKI